VQIILVEAALVIVASTDRGLVVLRFYGMQGSPLSGHALEARSARIGARVAAGEVGAKMSGELDAGDMRGLSREGVLLQDKGARGGASQRRDLHWGTNAKWSRKPAWFKRG
jgi:hypothetical protein